MLVQRVLGVFLVIAILPLSLAALPADDLQSASEAGKIAFVLVTEPGASGAKQATETIRNAMKQVEKSVMVELNRADSANAALVAKYRLAGAPVPLILVFASNGAIAGGNLAAKLTSEQLVNMVPSPKKAEVLEALQAGQAIFLTASGKEMSAKSDILNICAVACGQMKGKSCSIAIDMDDKKEASFLKELGIKPQSAEPVTVVINGQGQVTGSFDGPVDVSKLVQAANKRVAGCSPSGCGGKPCGPTSKKKGK